MKEELTLLHIAKRLPFGLMFRSSKHQFKYQEFELLKMNGLSIDDNGGLNIEFLHENDLVFSNSMNPVKPIFRPLSDLTKEIIQGGETFVPADKLQVIDWGDITLQSSIFREPNSIIIEDVSWKIYQKLLEWHFDVEGLIEKGLAISVNSLNTNPYN